LINAPFPERNFNRYDLLVLAQDYDSFIVPDEANVTIFHLAH